MDTRADVYREFAVAAEIGQAIEHDLGRVLLVHQGLEERMYLFDEPWELDEASLDAVHRNTLGASLRQIRNRYHLLGPFEPLDVALEARNFLAHRFFVAHLDEINSEQGCAAMCEHLRELQRQLWSGHQIARGMADFLVSEYERLWREHHH